MDSFFIAALDIGGSKMAATIANATGPLVRGLTRSDDLPNDWTFIPLEAPLRAQFSTVVIENDCIAALTAERCFGAAQHEPNCSYVTWSTGIGFG